MVIFAVKTYRRSKGFERKAIANVERAMATGVVLQHNFNNLLILLVVREGLELSTSMLCTPRSAAIGLAFEVDREGITPQHADFQSAAGYSRGLSINHLQRLVDPFPGTPRHNPGTPNLSWSRCWHSLSYESQVVGSEGEIEPLGVENSNLEVATRQIDGAFARSAALT